MAEIGFAGQNALPDVGGALACRSAATLGPAAEIRPVSDKRLVELSLVAAHCVLRGKEMPARADFRQRAEADIRAVRRRLVAHFGDHLQDFHVRDQLFIGHGQSALEPAGGMDDDGRPCHQAPPQRELCLVGRLNVIDVGRRPAGAAPWQIDYPRQLTGNERGAEMLRSPEGRGTGFHIHIRGEGAVANRRARVH